LIHKILSQVVHTSLFADLQTAADLSSQSAYLSSGCCNAVT